MKDLIGLEFKRNKYGITAWTSKIVSVWFSYSLTGDYFKVIPMITAENGQHYELTEVVVIKESHRKLIQRLEKIKQTKGIVID